MRSTVENSDGHIRHSESFRIQAIRVLSQVRSMINVRRFNQDAKDKGVTRKVGATVWTSRAPHKKLSEAWTATKMSSGLMSWTER
jgi:hypothetical protein